jgi:hypothetical protein
VEADSAVARREVSGVAEVTMATAADIPTSVEVATTEDTLVMVGTGARDGMAATTVGTAEIGAIHTTVTDGDWVLALGGRIIGVGDTRIATVTALGITLATLTTTRIIVLRDTHVLPPGTMILRLRIPAQNPGATQQIGHRR